MPSETQPIEPAHQRGHRLRRLAAGGAVLAATGIAAVIGTPAIGLAQTDETTTTVATDQSTDTTVTDESTGSTESDSTTRPDRSDRDPDDCDKGAESGSDT